MAWLVGIICVIIAINYWRVFLPLVMVVAICVGIFLLYENHQSEKRREEEQFVKEAVKQKVKLAQQSATSEGKEWRVYYEPDPASGVDIARAAFIKSDDELCSLAIEKRIDGIELTGIDCDGIKISIFKEVDIKFDIDDTSRKMQLMNYNDTDGVYIPSYQNSGYLNYKSFIDRFYKANSMAIKVPAHDNFWTRFSLKGAADAISKLGKPKGYVHHPNNWRERAIVIKNDRPKSGYQAILWDAEMHCKKILPTMKLGNPNYNKCVSAFIETHN